MADDETRRALVRVIAWGPLFPNGRQVGSGFLMAPRLVATCFHVLVPRARWDLSRTTWRNETKRIQVSFLRWEEGEDGMLRERLVEALLAPGGSRTVDDVALLDLISPEPLEFTPLRLAREVQCRDPYNALAFHQAEQVLIAGQVMTTRHQPTRVVPCELTLSVTHDPGFSYAQWRGVSGTPAFLDDFCRVGGMIRSVRENLSRKVYEACAVTVGTLREALSRYVSSLGVEPTCTPPAPARPIQEEDLARLPPIPDAATVFAQALEVMTRAGLVIEEVEVRGTELGSLVICRVTGPRGKMLLEQPIAAGPAVVERMVQMVLQASRS